ncbi:unnamed protein product, partial [Prorocentrum cordatum]
MPKSKPFTVCSECGQWVYNWRLDRQGGQCKCGAWLERFQGTPPWRSNRYGQQHAGSSAAAWWGPRPGESDGKAAAMDFLAGGNKQLAKKIEELQRKHAPPPPQPRPPDAWQALTKAKGHHQKAQKWLLECEDELERLSILHDEALFRRDQALENAFDADQARAKASAAYYKQVGKGELVKAEGEEPGQAEVQTILDFSVDDRLLDASLDEYEDGPEKEAVLAFRTKLADIQQAGKTSLQKIDEAEAALVRQQSEVRQKHAEEAKQLRDQAEQHQQLLVQQVEQLPSLRKQLRKKRRTEDGQAASGEAAKKEPGEQPAAEPGAAAAEPAGAPDAEAAQRRKQMLLDYQAKVKAERAVAVAKGGGKGKPGSAGDRQLFFANVEKWGPQAHKYVNEYQERRPRASVMGICETHLLPDKQKKVAVDLDRGGWKTTATAARPSGLSRGDPFRGFVATTIHAKAGNVIYVTAYMAPQWGKGSPNPQKLASLAALLRAVDDPWIVAADWNLDPEQLLKSEFPQKVGGVVKAPQVTKVTCAKGEQGSLLDYCLVRKDFADPAMVEAELEVPWKEQEAIAKLYEEDEVCQGPKTPFQVPLECWRACPEHAGRGPVVGARTGPAQQLDDHVAYQGREEQEKDLSHRYGNWVSKLELALLAAHEVEESEKARYQGRGGDFDLKWVKAKVTPGRARTKCHKSDAMCYALTLMQRCQTLSRGRRDEAQRGRVSCKLKRIARETLDQGMADFFGSARFMVWQKMMVKVETLSAAHRQKLLELTGALAAAGQARAMGEARRAYTEWVKEMWSDKMGVLHKHVKDEPTIINEICTGTSTTADPAAIMNDRASKWRELWQDPKVSLEDFQGQLRRTLEVAKEEDYPPVEPEEFDRALNSINGRKAMGVDVLSSTEVQRLPHEAREELRQLMNDAEVQGVWPRQCMAVVAASVPKPAGGDRVLGMIALMPKIWSNARGGIVDNWTEQLGAFWDGALRGCSALSAALYRALASATLLLDLQTFYDTISLALLMELAVQAKYPAIVVAMEVELLLGPRILKDQRHGISELVWPTRSVVAGSARGVSLAKVFIRGVLEKAREVAPQAPLWTFVDDTTARCEGSRLMVKQGMKQVATQFVEGSVEERGLIISNKSKLLASDTQLGRELQAELESPALPLQLALGATDLGGDAAAGRRRCCKKRRTRLLAAGRRGSRIMRMRRSAALAKEARGLWSTGASPQATCGHQLQGLAPSSVRRLRQRAGAAVGGKAGGRCLTMVLAAGLEEGPAIKLRIQLVDSWLELWGTAPQVHARIHRVWPAIRGTLLSAGAARRWRRVRGPVGTLVAPLMDVGWDPRTAGTWSRPEVDGTITEWHLVESSSEAFGSFIDRQPILHDLREDIMRQLWKQAAAHEDGGNLGSGADMLH